MPDIYTNVKRGEVVLENYVQIGAGSIILPAVTISEGSVTGAMTLVNKNLKSWKIYAGTPAREINERKRNLLEYVGIIQNS